MAHVRTAAQQVDGDAVPQQVGMGVEAQHARRTRQVSSNAASTGCNRQMINIIK